MTRTLGLVSPHSLTGPASIDAVYRQVQARGVATLSYLNVFEFGMNVRGHASAPPVPAKPDDYRNATLYAQNHLAGTLAPPTTEQVP